MKHIGSVLIGVVTAAAGYPVINAEGFNPQGLIVCTGCVALWLIVHNIITK